MQNFGVMLGRELLESLGRSNRLAGNESLDPVGHFVGREIVGWEVEIAGSARVLQAIELFGARGGCPIRSALPRVDGCHFCVEEDQHLGVSAHFPQIAHSGMLLRHHAYLGKATRQQASAQRAFARRTRPYDDNVAVVIFIIHLMHVVAAEHTLNGIMITVPVLARMIHPADQPKCFQRCEDHKRIVFFNHFVGCGV